MDLFDRLCAARPDAWKAYSEHPFVDALGHGTLSEAAFRTYLVQDWLFLGHFARAHALAVFKGRDLADMRRAARTVSAILDVEMALHVGFAADWGLTEADLDHAAEHAATTNYTRWVIDTGLRGDLFDLQVALAPCIVGYAEIAGRLAKIPGSLGDGNRYARWIAEYSGEAYGDVAAAARYHLDELGAHFLTPSRFEHAADIFAKACRLEADFWEMGWVEENAGTS